MLLLLTSQRDDAVLLLEVLKAADLLRREASKRRGGLEREDYHAEVVFNGAKLRKLLILQRGKSKIAGAGASIHR